VEPQRDVFAPLNGLRGVAALCVVIYHSSVIMGVQVAPRGYLAVDLFFVLSGFVIAHAYERRFRHGLKPLVFFWWRLKRFYPLYLTGFLIGACAMALDLLNPPAALTWRQFGAALIGGALFLPLPLADLYPLNVPAWSLLCELLVNLIYGLLWKRRIALAVLAVVSGLALLMLSYPIRRPDLATGMLRACFSFPVGVFIHRFRARLPLLPIPAWFIIAALGVVLLTPFPELPAIGLAFPLGIALLARCDNGPGFELLGRLSFPLYAVHWPLLQLGLGLKRHIPLDPVVQGWAWVAVAVAAAWAADRLIDRRRHAIRP
jgi:peptidoglycan/LPS O-acetylase OafA/YrhL